MNIKLVSNIQFQVRLLKSAILNLKLVSAIQVNNTQFQVSTFQVSDTQFQVSAVQVSNVLILSSFNSSQQCFNLK